MAYDAYGMASPVQPIRTRMIGMHRLVFLIAVTASAQARLQYLDFGSNPHVCCMVTDAQGNAYVAAEVSTSPTTGQIVVYKVDPLDNVVYRMAFGGSGGGIPAALAVDSSGDLFVTGYTSATDFPLVNPPIHASPSQSGTGFLSKIDPTGSRLLFSTLVGGVQTPSMTDVDGLSVDVIGNVYLTGYTTAADFPLTPNAFSIAGNAFVMKVTNAGDRIVFSTFLGPGARGYAIGVDGRGAITVAGSVSAQGFPVTPGAFQSVCYCNQGSVFGPPMPARTGSFVSRLSPDGSQLVWSTFLGGSGALFGPFEDVIHALALTSDGGVVVAGTAGSLNFPVTPGAFQTSNRGHPGEGPGTNVFVTRLNSTGTSLTFSTLLGGSINDVFYALALDAQEHPWVSGRTVSPDFPFLPTTPPIGDEFVVELASDGSSLVQTQRFPEGAARLSLSLAAGSEILFGSTGSLIRIPPGGLSGISIVGQANAGAYSVSGHVAPGEVVSLYGGGLGPVSGVGAQLDSTGKVSTSLAGVQVTFDGVPAPLLYVGNSQINVVVPFEVAAKTQTSLQVLSASTMSFPLQLGVVSADPSIFSYLPLPSVLPPAGGPVFAAALNQDNSYNTPANPAVPGSIVVFWANGAGVFTPPLTNGELPEPPLAQPAQPVSVLFDGQAVELLYQGAAPSVVAGLLQLNARLPQTMNPGTYHTLQLKIGNFTSAQVQVAAHP